MPSVSQTPGIDKAPGNASASEYAEDTTLVRAMAAVLVANSHLERFYPRPWLAGDGLIGNSLFFLLAGFGLASSARRIRRPFLGWMWRRVKRIYPSVILVVLVFGVLIEAQWRTWDATQYLIQFIWPTRFTFVELVMPMYILFYVLLHWRNRRAIPGTLILLPLAYAALYWSDIHRMDSAAPLRLGERSFGVNAIAYAEVMTLGVLLAARPSAKHSHSWIDPLLFIGSWIAYVILKFLMVQGTFPRAYALLHVLTAVICYLTFTVFTRNAVVAAARRTNVGWRLTGLVAGTTLEIYLVHTYIADSARIAAVLFPLNIGIFWALTLPLAALTKRCTDWFMSCFRNSKLSSNPSVSPITAK